MEKSTLSLPNKEERGKKKKPERTDSRKRGKKKKKKDEADLWGDIMPRINLSVPVFYTHTLFGSKFTDGFCTKKAYKFQKVHR